MIPNIKEHIDGVVCTEDILGIGSLIAKQFNVPICYIRNKRKEWGLKNKVEGDLKKVLKGQNVIFIGQFDKKYIKDEVKE